MLDLPPELLIRALSFLGAQWFQHDSRRLLVCKQWYFCASTVFYRELYLSSSKLIRLVQDPKALDRIKTETTDVSLKINGTGDLVEHSIQQFAGKLQESPRARALRLTAPSACRHLEASVVSLLACHLSTLKVDTRGLVFHYHICHSIGALLPTLQHLQLRMPFTCRLALTTSSKRLPLKTAIIITSLGSRHTADCYTGSIIELRKQIIAQAKELSAISSPEVFRIFWHTLPEFKLQYMDVLSSKIHNLPDGGDWHDEGEVVSDESESESESDISSLDSL